MLKRYLNKPIYSFANTERVIIHCCYVVTICYFFGCPVRDSNGAVTAIKDISMFYGVYFGFEYKIIL